VADLICGSYGTLGLITSAKVLVHPRPTSRAWVMQPVRSPLEVRDRVLSLLGGGLSPSAIEVDLPLDSASPEPGPGRRRASSPSTGSLGVLLDGPPTDVSARSRAAAALLGGPSSIVDSAPWWWGMYPFGPGDVALKLVAPPADLHAGIYALRDATGVPVAIRGSAGSGVVYAALAGSLPLGRVTSALVAVHATLMARGGACIALSAPPWVRDAIDLWSIVPPAPRTRQTKDQLDPSHTLAPGRSAPAL
jgi:glycolate oxidase FAD binding subunit